MTTPIAITAFYKFAPLEKKEIERLQKKLLRFGKRKAMRGLVILAEEGMNGTVSGNAKAIRKFQKILRRHFGLMVFKNSQADEQPFKRWLVKIRQEIVGLKDASIIPKSDKNNHLSPTEWHKAMQEEDVMVLDARNDYETKIGVFKNAVDPNLKQFQDFPEYVKHSGIPKDKKVLMYCTGGIRCEKALIEMQRQGYEHVYQLQGGILQYLEEYPEGFFEGECFVFDHRAAVDKNLKPSSQYIMCPHCGDPGKERIVCAYCGEKGRICDVCMQNDYRKTCSKDCAHRKLPLERKQAKSMIQ